MHRTTARTLLLLVASILLVGVAPPASASAQDKGPLTHEAYDSWRSIRGATLSDDGDWLLYAEVPQDGDAELVVRQLGSGVEYRHALGYLTADSPFVSSIDAEFAPSGDHVVFLVAPDKAEVEAAEEQEGGDGPRAALGLMELSTGRVVTVPGVKSFAVPEDSGDWIAYLMEEPLAADEDSDSDTEQETVVEPEPAAEPAQGEADESADKDKDYGTELRLRWLADGSEVHEPAVLEYHPTDNGSVLMFTVSSEEEPETDGVYALDVATRERRGLLTGEGNYVRLTFAEEGDRFAFLTDTADYEADQPVFELYGGTIGADAASLWVSHLSTDGFPDGMAVSDEEGITLSDDGSVVMFGIRPMPEPDDDEEAEEDEAVFDLWHWQDPYPQPQQLQMAEQVRNEAFESLWWIDEGRFVQLADEALPDVTLADDGSIAMGTSDRRWSDRHSYEGFFNDVILVDTATGDRTMVAERVSWGAQLSPGGNYVAWFGGDGDWIGYDRNGEGGFESGQDWFLHDVATGETRKLTESFDVPTERHDWDTPNLPAPYGSPGFTDDDASLVIYDRYDVWAFPTAGGEPVRVTEGVGRENGTSFRWVRLDPEQEGIPVDRPFLLSSTHEETMATGFWVDSIADPGDPVRLLGADARLGFVDLADGSSTMAFTRQTFSEFPDVWVGDLTLEGAPALNDVRKVTDLGAQTDPYLWGSAELREFRSADGLPLKGILITPENFDPEKKYPLMVYIYETLHPRLHIFDTPSPGTSIDFATYASNGYVIWMPDIEYVTPGYPGKDALKCVLPGINMLVREGFVDEDAIGIQGHSWGGYQIAYMLTQTDVFAAAESGAPVSNMTSAYGGIRWGSGLVRQFQYERTQSRLGASLWEVPLRYVENSPLFWADEVDTPVLMLHNDEDGAVPWYQGIEFMMALRRLGKEAYMFNYNGEAHGLRQRVNQEDWSVRMREFFDHHLRGEPAPDWMTEGVRGWEKGEVER